MKWKRCQQCGANAIYKPWAHTAGGDVGCLSCTQGLTTPEWWDKEQANTRARKRFELVCSMAGNGSFDMNAWANFEDDMQYSLRHIADAADVMLAELYGEAPK